MGIARGANRMLRRAHLTYVVEHQTTIMKIERMGYYEKEKKNGEKDNNTYRQ